MVVLHVVINRFGQIVSHGVMSFDVIAQKQETSIQVAFLRAYSLHGTATHFDEKPELYHVVFTRQPHLYDATVMGRYDGYPVNQQRVFQLGLEPQSDNTVRFLL